MAANSGILSKFTLLCGLILLATALYPALAKAEGDPTSEDLARQIVELDLEALLELKVTLTTRTPEKWYNSASAMYVITSEDIRSSGLTLVPELLRMAPGVQAKRLDANKWGITIRGFNERFVSKLQVLVDGRIVYNALFSGVYWDIQDLVVDDIDRIEVVRGPGAALWGSNAVNGIINIVTKHASETQGGLVVATAGDEDTKFQGTGRYGFTKNNLQMRVYGRYTEQGAGVLPPTPNPALAGTYVPGDEADDGWEQWHLGFRGDATSGNRDRFSFFGDIYAAEMGQNRVVTFPAAEIVPDSVEASGGYAGIVWQRSFSPGSDLNLRLFYDHTTREDVGLWEKRNTYTADLDHRVTTGRHELMWGAAYRSSADKTARRSSIFFDPPSRTLNRGTVFVQDRVGLNAARTVAVTLGMKVESNNSTGVEYQPSARLLWMPSKRFTIWSAISRAVRTPSRADDDMNLEVAPGTVFPLGDPDLVSEEVLTLEAGGRYRFARNIYLDAALFDSDYTNLILDAENKGSAGMTGGELSGRWEATSAWSMTGNWSYIDFHDRDPVSIGSRPSRHMASVRTSLRLLTTASLSASYYYTDPNGNKNPANSRLDLRLGWWAARQLELSVVGRNLLRETTAGGGGGTRLPSDVRRSVHATARLLF